MTPNVIPHRPRLFRLLALTAAALLVLSACGGDSDDADSTDPTDAPSEATTTVAGGDDAATTTDAGDTATTTVASGGGDGEYAIVTIGDETYEADFDGTFSQCISMGGAIGGVAPIAGVEDATIDMTIPPPDWETSAEGWDPPSIRLDLGEDADGVPIDWRAGGDIVMENPDLDGKSQVDSVSNDGTTASGTATFIDFFQVQLFQSGQVDEPQPVSGTFEISCG